MPKMKTHSGAKKRFRITKKGKVMRHSAYTSHLLTKKSNSRKKRLLKASSLQKGDAARIKLLLCK